MKSLFFSLSLLLSAGCFAQTLKDSLFSGKLKVDSALLIRSKGNVQNKISDTTAVSVTDSIKVSPTDTLVKQNSPDKTVIKYQDNNRIWKKFVDQYTGVINAEVLPAKKIKKGTYSVMLDYEIGTDGVVTTINISCIPENSYLVDQIKERMMPNAPLLAPLVRDGIPRKSKRRQMLVFEKEKN